MISIRLARPDDLAAIDRIYAHYVASSTCTYDEVPPTPEQRLAWFREHDEAHPATVAIDSADEIVGFGSLSRFRDRSGYRHTVENTLYVRHDRHRQGIGRQLLGDLIERASRLGHHTILAGISAEQTASIALHRAFGFQEVARLREVGFKFGTWLDVVFVQRMLR